MPSLEQTRLNTLAPPLTLHYQAVRGRRALVVKAAADDKTIVIGLAADSGECGVRETIASERGADGAAPLVRRAAIRRRHGGFEALLESNWRRGS